MICPFCSYPLLHIPLPGTIPTKIVLPFESPPLPTSDASTTAQSTDQPATSNSQLFHIASNLSFEQQPFPWASSDPFIYIQQIVLRTSVIPWKKNLLLTDAYRGPLHEIFKLLESVRNYEDDATKTNLANICLHVENVKMPNKYPVFPEYNCLTLSPANLWQQNAQNFKKDTNLLSTIFHHHVRLLIRRPIPRRPLACKPNLIQFFSYFTESTKIKSLHFGDAVRYAIT